MSLFDEAIGGHFPPEYEEQEEDLEQVEDEEEEDEEGRPGSATSSQKGSVLYPVEAYMFFFRALVLELMYQYNYICSSPDYQRHCTLLSVHNLMYVYVDYHHFDLCAYLSLT